MNYNLLQERWIPVLWTNGEVGRVGIKTALTESGHIRQIAASNPMDRVAIIRFLLAVLYWCKGDPLPDADATSGDSFPADWFSKLDDSFDCFNLLSDGKRFYQYRKHGDKLLSANYLIHEIPTGTNKWHFRHSTDEVEGLCPACCAMGLLRLPLFSTSGGRGKPPGINAKPPIYVIPMGESLAVTLRLSWRQISDLGIPAWEQPDLQLPEIGEVPLLTGLTWLPRRVWLDNPKGPESACISCGRIEHMIKLCVFAPIGSTKTGEGSPGRIWRDPHVIYEQSGKGDIPSLHSLHAYDALGAADAAAGQWAKIMAGMLRKVARNDRISLWAVGFSTVQNDKYLEAIEYLVPFPSSQNQTETFIEKIEQWQKQCGGLVRNLVRKVKTQHVKASSRKHVEIPPVLAAIRPHVEGTVSARMDKLLSGGDNAWEQAAAEYSPMMDAIAKSLSPGFTISAVQRRKEIAKVLPDMRPKAESAEKTHRKKGGEK